MSVLDGWWDEGWTGDNGWAIGGRDTGPDDGAQDWADAQDLHGIAGRTFCRLTTSGARTASRPPGLGLMRAAIASTIWRFSTTRMLHEYTELLYLPAAGIESPSRSGTTPRHRSRLTRRRSSTRLRARRRTSVGSPHLASPRHPQSPAGRQLRLGLRRGLSAGLLCRWSRHSSRHPCAPVLHYRSASSGSRPSGRTSSPGSARSSARPRRAARRRPVRAGPRPRSPNTTGSALRRMADVVESIAGRRPRGAWLAERVWEPDLPTSLVEAGYRWSILDDAHFRAATIPEEDLWGPYTTEDQGRLLTVFGTEQGLRYRIPFREVGEVIGYLRDHASEAGDRVGMMGDDGEKFGAWPTTYEHCWGRGRWVDRFFEALEMNRDWLTTVTPRPGSTAIRRSAGSTSRPTHIRRWANGRCPPARRWYADVLHRPGRAIGPRLAGCVAPSGATSRSSTVRSAIPRQMLRTSAKVRAMPESAARSLATDHLHRGQSNDCYWHGLFGGMHQPHASGDAEHLIAAEDCRHRRRPTDGRGAATSTWTGSTRSSLPHPGRSLPSSSGPEPASAAGTSGPRHALTAVLRRREEAYHETLRRHEAPASTAGDATDRAGGDPSEAPASIATSCRPRIGLAARLHYDDYERRSGLIASSPQPRSHRRSPTRTAERARRREGRRVRRRGARRGSPRRTARGCRPGDGNSRQPVTVTRTLTASGDRRSPFWPWS